MTPSVRRPRTKARRLKRAQDGTGSVRILIAEDHFDSRDALRALLEAFGYEVVVAANGREALEVAAREAPDVVLMDIMMPELDGFEATRLLRQQPATRGLPIIAITAMEGAPDRALQAGANDFVRKPLDIQQLLEKLESCLTPDARP